MSCGTSTSDDCDLARGRSWLVFWGLPTLAVGAGMVLPGLRMWLWTPAFAAGGIACLANAGRCGRLHCFFTGPLFLIAALGSLAMGLGWLGIEPGLFLAAIGVCTLLAYVPEWLRGRYVRRDALPS